MKLKIEAEKKALVQKKDMEEEEKNKAARELEKRQEDLVEAEWVKTHFIIFSWCIHKEIKTSNVNILLILLL